MQTLNVQTFISNMTQGLINPAALPERKRILLKDANGIVASRFVNLTSECDWQWLEDLFPEKVILNKELKFPTGDLVGVNNVVDLNNNDVLYITFEN